MGVALPILRHVLIAALLLAFQPVFAADYLRMTADLGGKGKPETIVVTTGKTGEFREFVVRIGAARYKGKFFAAEGDLPDVRIIAISRASPRRQILVTTSEPTSCNHYVLSYARGRIIPLLETQSGANCAAPQPNGNGTLTVGTWAGFWTRHQTYRLSAGGTKLVPIPQEVNDVKVSAYTLKEFTLEPAKCGETAVLEGEFVRVDKYDSTRHLYLISTRRGACGWLPEDQIEQAIGGLPWAN